MDIGTWGRASGFVGIVVKKEEDGTLVLFNPGDRQMLRATPGVVQSLPTGAVEVTVSLQDDVPHGHSEDALKRWTAALLDPVLRQRGGESLREAGLDAGPFALEPSFDVREVNED